MSTDIAKAVRNRRESTGGKADVIDIQVDEAKMLAALQMDISRKYAGMEKDLRIWSALRNELEERCAEIGFVAEVGIRSDAFGNWYPECSIIGRTDARIQGILNAEGPDIERKAWDAKRESSSELAAQGVNVGLL